MAQAHVITSSILDHVAGSGTPDFASWGIGLTTEPPEAGTDRGGPVLVFWEADSLAVAEIVEAFFVYEKRMQCVTDGTLDPDRTVLVCLFPADSAEDRRRNE